MWIFKYILQFFKRKNVEPDEPNECDFTQPHNIHILEEINEILAYEDRTNPYI